MGQVSVPQTPPSLILTSLDRLVASNADGGLSPLSSHVVLLGEDAGQNLGDLDYVYVIGAFSLDAGLTTTAKSGTAIYGGQIMSAYNESAAPAGEGPILAAGYNLFPLQTGRMGRNVILGQNIGENMPALASDVSDSVFIGPDILQYQRILAANGGSGYIRSVFIGSRVLEGSAAVVTDGGGTTCADSVVIGDRAMQNTGSVDVGIPGAVSGSLVVIGAQAGQNLANAQNSAATNVVMIGATCASNVVNCTNSVFVGAGITGQPGTGAGSTTSMTLIGHGIVGGSAASTSGNTVLGALANISGVGSRNILIGEQCNASAQLPNNVNDKLVVETSNGTLLYGYVSSVSPGGLIVGHSTQAANRDLPGFNILKLINGTVTGVAPAGGGFFYSTGGNLHWVTTGNVDFALTPNASLGIFTFATLPAAPPASSRAFITDGAAAPVFAAAAAGGGAVFTPVYYSGAAWLNG